MITEDDYFSRAWIAQENTAANATILLLRCDSTLIRPESMGSLDGEIQLPLCEFRVACAKLAGAFQNTIEKTVWYYERATAQYGEDDWFDDRRRSFRHGRHFRRPPSIEQFKASIEPDQQWQIYFQSFLSKSRGSRVARRHEGRYHCSAAEAIEFLSTKHNYEIADRLAIIANLCNYEVRLDAQKLKELGYNLAVSVFCLALLNGDLSLARLPDGMCTRPLIWRLAHHHSHGLPVWRKASRNGHAYVRTISVTLLNFLIQNLGSIYMGGCGTAMRPLIFLILLKSLRKDYQTTQVTPKTVPASKKNGG
jgi:hypothetical protein